MTEDLVKRLRDYTCGCGNGNLKHTTWDAADRIEELEAALRGVIAIADRDCPEFREARAALGGKKDGNV